MDLENSSRNPTASTSDGDISVNLSVINIRPDTNNELPRENRRKTLKSGRREFTFYLVITL